MIGFGAEVEERMRNPGESGRADWFMVHLWLGRLAMSVTYIKYS